jgi:biopolymer transport protein ExbD
MAIGKLNDKLDEDEEIIAEINITPLTDIFLVLLIIFMITSSALIESGANIDLPKVSKTETVSRSVVVALTANGGIYINQKRVSEEGFIEELRKALGQSSEKLVILEGDRDAILGDAVRIMEMAKEAGAEKIAVAAEKDEKR